MYGDEREEVSANWLQTYDLSSTMIPNVSSAADDEEHFCKLILYKEIQDSRVRIWDIVILIPNLLFLLFIVVRFNRARLKLRATSSPIFLAFYGLVICNVVISVIRCVVSMTVNAAASVGGKADKVLWVTVRFFLLSTEMSVVIFGLAFGHLDSRSSIRRVLLATSLIALAFTITQGTLELVLPDDTFHIPSRDFYVFGHGGMMFWFCSSLVFTMIYLFILILPWTRLRERLALPTRKSFYVYAGTLAMLDLVQSLGAGFLNYTQNPVGLCIVDFTAAVYLTLFTPLVYHTFLSGFLGVSQPSIMFSYKAQVDDAMDEDTVSLPHQQSFSSLKTDSDYIYQVHTPSIHMPLYDSQASKSSTSKHRTSLYSLSSTKDSKSSSVNTQGSQVTLYKSRIKSFAGRLGVEKNVSDLANYPLTKSDNFIDAQKSSPDLRVSNPSWKTSSTSQFKYGGPSSVTNLLLSSATASNFLYKPKVNDSNVNLFAQGRKGSLENAITTFTSSDKMPSDLSVFVKDRSDETIAPEISDIAPLENTLQSILDSGINDREEKNLRFAYAEKSKDGTSQTRGSLLDRHAESEVETEVEDASSSSTDISNITHKLLSKSISFRSENTPEKQRKDARKKESAGLNDYLLSLTTSNVKKLEKDSEVNPKPSPHRAASYTQTDSL
ncbi:hypothetical protein KM043_014167 [Ampulex compressa]|nr:hypothetical protein KM043_014167 [Ampulex compressa]